MNRRIFGDKGDEITDEWRKVGLHNYEQHVLCCTTNKISNLKLRRLRWAGHVTQMGNERAAWKLLVGKPEGKHPGRPRMRWENNINHDLRKVDYTGMIGNH